MADGSKKPIEKVVPGDVVKSWKKADMIDEKVSGWYNWETDRVDDGEHLDSHVIVNRVNTYMHYHILKLSNGSELKVTWEHPLFVKQGDKWSFKQVKKINVNDKLKDENNAEVNIDVKETYWQPIVTFNLDVEETDTYYADGVLAHNTDHTKLEESLQAQANETGTTIPEGQTATYFYFNNELTDSKMLY
jgi:hypothetical protein